MKDMRQESGPKHFAGEEPPASLPGKERHWLGADCSGWVKRGSQLFSQSLKLVAGRCLALAQQKKVLCLCRGLLRRKETA